ncbi:MAG: uroporphyrinogen-III synthase [Sulfitobacter sp.]
MTLPTLLLTRPRPASETFVASLDPIALAQVNVLIAPLMNIAATGGDTSLGQARGVIFTSANGVLHGPEGAGRSAYCVGVQTTQQARARGWDARQVGDTANELTFALCNKPLEGPLIHFGGAHTRGDVAETLTAAGIATRHVTLYAQTLLPMEKAALSALDHRCILPVFSPRTAQHLVGMAADRLSNSHIIALSAAVAGPFGAEKIAELIILPAPQAGYMRKAVENLCLTPSLP